MNEKAVLDVVDLATLEYAVAEEQVNTFEATWGMRPVAVALPVVSPNGIPFESGFDTARGVRYGGVNPPKHLGGIAYEFAKLGLDVILTVNPSLGFVRSDTLHIVDITGRGSAQACIAKFATQRLLKSLIKQASENVRAACDDASKKGQHTVSLTGIALDIVDLWPMGADDERVKLTCFCRECRDQLASISKQGKRLLEPFERFPNPWNLVLRDSGTGVEPISDLSYGASAKSIINISHLQGFDATLERAGLDLAREAEWLMEYMQARHRQVVRIVKGLLEDPAKDGLSRILIVEGERYGWTSGVFFERLDDPEVCDELWFDPSEQGFTVTKVRSKAYMWRRSRYFPDAFFDFLSQSQDEEKRTITGLARLPDSRLKHLLELRRRQAMAGQLSAKIDLLCLHPLAETETLGRVGFVGANLTEALSKQLVENAKIVGASPDLIEPDSPESADLAELLARLRNVSDRNDET